MVRRAFCGVSDPADGKKVAVDFCGLQGERNGRIGVGQGEGSADLDGFGWEHRFPAQLFMPNFAPVVFWRASQHNQA